jgi:penicillin-binding protein 2
VSIRGKKIKMLVVDELKKNDPTLRLVAIALAAGLCILFVGLWWVQVVSSREYQSHRDKQAYRTVRLPAVRGKISDREGRVLAENQPRYDLSLFLDELRQPVFADYTNLLHWAKQQQQEKISAAEKSLGRKLNKAELKTFSLTQRQRDALLAAARERVAGVRAAAIGEIVGAPIALDVKKFKESYARYPYMPYPILPGLDAGQIARFQENYTNGLGADLAMESIRHYPNGTTAAHLLGYVTFSDEGQAGDRASYNYEVPDCKGRVGIEAGLDAELRGNAGEESVLINSHGYRQSGNIENAPEPGRNAVLTLDLDLQRVAEKSIMSHQGANARAGVVVLDVRNGDVLAMVSSPAINPIYNENSAAYLNDETLKPAINRATQEIYLPGSIFKVVIGLAALEAGLNPDKQFVVEANPEDREHGLYNVRGVKKKDTAIPGLYNFKRAIERSSNSYFIQVGLQAGIDRIIALAEKFHFGQKAHLPTLQDSAGKLPSLDRVHHGWREGDSANICIGQGGVSVTLMQVAVAYAAIANGGTVFAPRLVMRTEPQDLTAGGVVKNFAAGRVRDQLGVSARSLKILHAAMNAETEDAEGTGKEAVVGPAMRICGKTGTAQRTDEHNNLVGWNYWFASFAPYESPRYAVVVMVQSENKGSGGLVCAPIAHDIYAELLRKENLPKENAVARK